MVNAGVAESSPIRALAARVLTFRGRAETYASQPALFQGLCALLKEGGALAPVYPELARIKQRILGGGPALTVDDVLAVADAYNQSKPGDPVTVSPVRAVLSVPGTPERLAYHRELTHNLKLPHRPLLTLNSEALAEVLTLVIQPRLWSDADRAALRKTEFLNQETGGLARILETIYRATFSRTIRKELCEPTILFPLGEGSFHLLVDLKKTAHLTLPLTVLVRPLFERLAKSPDLAGLVGTDERLRARLEEGLRQMVAALQEPAPVRPWVEVVRYDQEALEEL